MASQNSRIILIETSTSLCSVALAEDGVITSHRESAGTREHASLTAPFVKEVLDERGLKVHDCAAVCVSAGPGSYTGLRVGSSTAKGLCFGAGIPLISVGTLEVLVSKAISEGLVPDGCSAIVPMVDARRMEVYSAVFTPDGNRVGEITPMIVEANSFERQLSEGKVLFIGDGAGKCQDVITSANAVFVQCCPDAMSMAGPATKKLEAREFENTAYFEPFYLKEFVATVSKKKLF